MRIAVIPGDGIGVDTTTEAVKAIRAVGERIRTAVRSRNAAVGRRLFPADRHHHPGRWLCDAARSVRRDLHRRARRSAGARQPARARHPARHALRARSLRQLPAGEAARRAAVSAEGPHDRGRELRRLPREHRRALRQHRRAVQGGDRGRGRDPGRAQHLQGRPSHHQARLRVRAGRTAAAASA